MYVEETQEQNWKSSSWPRLEQSEQQINKVVELDYNSKYKVNIYESILI